MSAIPYGAAFEAWVNAYGCQGEQGPIPTDSELLGGTHHGERVNVPDDYRTIKLPIRERPRYIAADAPEPYAEFRVEMYEKRTFLPCWSASPVRRLVLSTLDDKDAMALVQELAHGGPDEREWDAEADFARAQHDAAMRRLRELRDQLDEDGLL